MPPTLRRADTEDGGRDACHLYPLQKTAAAYPGHFATVTQQP